MPGLPKNAVVVVEAAIVRPVVVTRAFDNDVAREDEDQEAKIRRRLLVSRQRFNMGSFRRLV